MKLSNYLLSLSMFLFVGSIIMASLSCNSSVLDDSNGVNQEVGIGHKCNWKGCDYEGLNQLPAPYNPIDSIHFSNPYLSYDSVEAIVLNNNL